MSGEDRSEFSVELICGVPVLQWRGSVEKNFVNRCQQVLQALFRSGHHEAVLNLNTANTGQQEPRRFLRLLDKAIPGNMRLEIVLPPGSPAASSLRRAHVAQSVALAISRITRLPAASLQGALPTHVHWYNVEPK